MSGPRARSISRRRRTLLPFPNRLQFAPPPETGVGDFEGAFAAAPVKLDETYTTPDQSHAMMEPHATIAAWEGDRLTLWTAIQQINWGVRDLAKTLGIPKENVRLVSPYIGGGFGGKGTILSDAVMAALAAREARRPVKVTLPRAMMMNNTTHRPATIQRIRIGATKDGKITAIGHESWSGNLAGGRPESATISTRLLYAGPNRMTRLRLAQLDLPEGSAMRAPGEAPGMMALEIAMDEMAEKLGIDPIEFRIINDTQVQPDNSGRPPRPILSRRAGQHAGRIRRIRDAPFRDASSSNACAPARPASAGARAVRARAARAMAAGWSAWAWPPPSAARRSRNRPRVSGWTVAGIVTVETDMTDIGTGSYTIIAQTAAEMMGVGLDKVVVRLGDSRFPEFARLGRTMGRGFLDRGGLRRLRQAARGRGAAPRLQLRRRRIL